MLFTLPFKGRGGPRGQRKKKVWAMVVNVLRLAMTMSSFFKVDLQGQMEDLGTLILAGKRSGETPRAQGASWGELEFLPSSWAGLERADGEQGDLRPGLVAGRRFLRETWQMAGGMWWCELTSKLALLGAGG